MVERDLGKSHQWFNLELGIIQNVTGSFDGGMRKPTRQEALDRLPSIPKPVRGLRPKPRNPWLLPLYALDLAEILIYIDPLDRIEG